MINFGWGDYDHSYGVLSFNGHWTTEDFGNMVSSLRHEINVRGQSVNLMIDLRHSAVPPMSIMNIATDAITGRSMFIGRVIVISKTLLWKRLYDAITHHCCEDVLDIHFVECVDKAYELLLTADSPS